MCEPQCRLSREHVVWALAVIFYGVGDTVTTIAGLSVGGVAEAGPIVGPALERFGANGLLGVKIIMFSGCAFAWSRLARNRRLAIPLALAIVGVGVTVWNAVVVITAI